MVVRVFDQADSFGPEDFADSADRDAVRRPAAGFAEESPLELVASDSAFAPQFDLGSGRAEQSHQTGKPQVVGAEKCF